MPLAKGTLRDSSGRLVMHAPRRHRTTVAVILACGLCAVGFLVGQRALQHATAAVPAGSPFGHNDVVAAVPGGVRVGGWAIDPDAQQAALTVALYSDGNLITSVPANVPRPDVAAANPGAGPLHGYDTHVSVADGNHTVCVRAINIGPGADRTLGCWNMFFQYSPVGHLDIVAAAGGHVRVSGWTFDPDSPQVSLSAFVGIDGAETTITANQPRPDVGSAYPAAGALHGFSAVLPMPQGTHSVCAVAQNVGFGANRTIGCASLNLDDGPIGSLDVAGQIPGGFYLAGWADDPDSPATSLTMRQVVDGTSTTLLANGARPDVTRVHPSATGNHGFTSALHLSQGSHSICLTAVNIGYGSDRTLFCRSVSLNFNPSAGILSLSPTSTGAVVTGWAVDPDTSAPIHALVSADGHQLLDTVAGGARSSYSGHVFSAGLALSSGTHTICVVGVNVGYGTGNSPPACQSITLSLNPIGHWDSLARASGTSSALHVAGWAIDADTSGPVTVSVSVDGSARAFAANAIRNDVGAQYPAFGSAHGFDVTIAASDWEHTVCVTAINVGGGSSNTSFGCKLINAVHPVAPSAPRSVGAVAGFGGATVTWQPPSTDGGAPWTLYTVTAYPGGMSSTVGAATTSTTITGLAAKTQYTFAVTATNVAGVSAAGVSPAVTTLPAPPPQTTPAPISTSRYIRNVSGSSSADLSAMHAEGAADATSNPTGHGYLILLDIGGQDQVDGGVMLSATTRFVSYADLVRDLNAYVDGYRSAQRPSAPVTIAIGTNNDMDVTTSSGAAWAQGVVNPVASHAAQYLGMTIAGANDIEPGFRATYAQTRAWLLGYLGATSPPFVFNGSADGCAWTVPNQGCNNGWNMSGLYYLAAGASPVREINLPQIYNTTMAAQWEYISLTGVGQRTPRINFGGALTEYTACVQTNSCGSLTGNGAWQALWNDLQSQPALRVPSLPYSTDLRIDS
ncbi:MAG: fibronectin type III domain-containing protein [Actinomycetota bacterium]|nr:fibronectin type III domain-containing protein [Actinomycetota bacterium]